MKKEQVVNCQFSVWYPIFKKHTIKSLILPLPQNVIDYLLDDGTLVVSGSDHNTQQTQTNNSDSDAEEDIQVSWSLFSRLEERHKDHKWIDANWIALNSSLQCRSLSDIFLLFKSSDFITHDLTQPFLQCSDQDSPDPVINYELVLRKWSELIPGGEFRCFVKENKLIAISQRDYTQYYQHILKQEEQISQAIQDFFSQHIQYNVLDEDCDCIYGRVWLIDLNPFGEVTDSLLFTWGELTSGEVAEQQEGPAFRYTTSEVTVQPSPCLSYRIPRDFVDLSTGEDAYKLIDFLKLKKSQQEESEEEEEEQENAPQ
uniref:Translation initiation factor eIF2 assembly protein n=1 Tax=Neolamprologus brichardi TaxID=32507 RepID=A0A3Q4HT49_NEOBR